MQNRSIGLVALVVTTVMVALHTQMGAIVLVLGGSFFALLGSLQGTATLLLGALYVTLTVGAYATAYGIWARRAWAWNAAVGVYVTLAVATLLLVALAGNLIGLPLPVLASVVGLGLLTRPSIKAELLGREIPVAVPASEPVKAAEPVHAEPVH